jgi:hypothetical protein
LGIKAHVALVLDVSFGLKLTLLAMAIGNMVTFAKGAMLMKFSNAVKACVWFGAAFLPGLVV